MTTKTATKAKAKTTKSTAVAKKEAASTDVAGWGESTNQKTGFENADRSELAIPFINLLQSNSELVEDDDHPAKAGQFYNNVTEELLDSFVMVPCERQRVFVEWVPVEDGGGLVAVHDPNSEFVQNAIRENDGLLYGIKVADGKHDLMETYYLYCLLVDEDGSFQHAVIAFSSSKIKAYRKFFTTASRQQVRTASGRKTLPMWAHAYKVTSVNDTAKNKKFKNISITFDGDSAADARLAYDGELAMAGEEFNEMVSSGMAVADMSTAEADSSGSGTEAEAEGDIPF